MNRFCTQCGHSIAVSAKFCAACGAPAEDSAMTGRSSYVSSAPPSPSGLSIAQQSPSTQNLTVSSSPNVWLIITVIAFELIGDNLANHNGVTTVSVGLWTIATIIGIYLIATSNIINKIVGAVKVLLYVVWVGSIILVAASNHLSGTYSDSTGLVSMTFTPNGQFSMSGAGISSMNGTYQVSGNTLTLDPPGSSGSASNSTNDPTGAAVLQMFQSALTANISSDRRTIDYAGEELTKQ